MGLFGGGLRGYPRRPPFWPRLILFPALALALGFVIGSAWADEPVMAEGQFDSAPLVAAFNQEGLEGANEAANTISFQFPKEGGPITGEFALEFENFPLGAILVGVGQAIGGGVAGTIEGAFGGAEGTPESGPPPTPTAKERIILSCKSTLSLTGTLTGTYDAATKELKGEAQITGSAYKDLKCSEPVPGFTDTPQKSSVNSSTWKATFDGERLVAGVIAPATESSTPLVFEAEVLAPAAEPEKGAGPGSTPVAGGPSGAESRKPPAEGASPVVGETGFASRVLTPGSEMPSSAQAATAAALIATTATLMSLGVLRQPRTPRRHRTGPRPRDRSDDRRPVCRGARTQRREVARGQDRG